MTGRPVGIEEFRRLSLRVGTLLSIEPVLGDLAVVTVRLDAPVEALAPASCLPPEAAGLRVVVATGLHPLTVGGRRFTACLVTVDGRVPAITAEIPDGSPLS